MSCRRITFFFEIPSCVEFHTQLRINFDTVKRVNPPRNIVGPLLRELRGKRGLSQAQLATKLNLLGWDVSRDIIARIEGQVRWVADFEVVKLAGALEMDGAEFLRQAVYKAQKRPQSLLLPIKKGS